MSAYRYRGENAPFSHFYPSPIVVNGLLYPTVEHAYQLTKTRASEDFEGACILQAEAMTSGSGKIAKVMARNLEIDYNIRQPQWAAVKVHIMRRLDYEKYAQNPHLRQELLSTGQRQLIEDVPNDKFWGSGYNGTGQNVAGKLLMDIRHSLSTGQPLFPEIFIIGDSLVRHVFVLNGETICIPGAVSRFVTTTAAHIVGPNTKFLLIVAGTNDLFKRDGTIGSTNIIAKKMMQWAGWLAQYIPNCHIIICSILPRTAGTVYRVPLMKAGEVIEHYKSRLPKYFNDLIKFKGQYASGGNVHIFDSAQVITEQHLSGDGLHLSQAGAQFFSNRILSAINAIHHQNIDPCLF